ncbi:MAG TPA: glucose-1-phosphate adenylyltransferase [Erysipelotrichaceae bacterium]|nr:glucose-1-phosphate adenylyltransferase [Erysipelotrichaceae bacterium]
MSHNVVAMVLAGGKGTRLGILTKKMAKPAVSFAAKYRIIDFPLSNCANSGINTIAVLTQYEPTLLESYIGNGEKWGFNGVHSLLQAIAPRQTDEGVTWYKGTADAITQNIDFLDGLSPDYVLILSGDHIYNTTYNDMIGLHVSSKADATISVIEVDIAEASRFGIMAVDEEDRITEFQEKPKHPKSNLASMGVYVFTWKTLRKYLIADKELEHSGHDFGGDIIPAMLNDGLKLQAYRFEGYWRDVGTIQSLHEANMDMALNRHDINLYKESSARIFTKDTYSLPQYLGKEASVKSSLANQGAIILGKVNASVISHEVLIEEDAELDRCVVMENSIIKRGAKLSNVVVAPNSIVEEGAEVNLNSDTIVLVGGKVTK